MQQELFVFLACVALSSAQPGPGNLNSYDDIRAALIEGSEIQLNARAADCQSSIDVGNMIVSMPFRHWQVVTTNDTEIIRSDDYYIGTPPGSQEAVIVRQLTVNQDDSVVVNLSTNLNGSEPLNMVCDLGVGATAHRLIQGNDLVHIDEYQEAKSRLLFGDHVEVIGNLGLCENAAEVFPAGVSYITGYQINRFEIINEATPNEMLFVNDAAIIPIGLDQEALTVEQLLVFPDGSVVAVIGVISIGDLSPLFNITLECQLGVAFDFTLHQREDESTFANYGDLREATLNGHDMEIVVFLENCEILEGTPLELAGIIGSLRFDEFQLFPAGSIGNDLEYLSFTSYGLSVGGDLSVDVVRAYSDNTLTVEFFNVPSGSVSETNNHLLSCPMETASVFHAVGRTRNPANGFNQIVQEIVEQGQVFEIEINFANCQTSGLDSVYGGIVWESYIDPSLQGGYYFGSVFRMIQQNFTGTPAPAWEASDILILPDDSVQLTPRLFDLFTGENLFPDAPQDPIVCELGNNEQAGVRMFRWP